MIIKKIYILIISSLVVMFVFLPNISCDGVIRGLLISANVVIPSLFPFTVCVLIIIKLNINLNNTFITKITKKFFGLNDVMFFVFILSLIGGYPIGAKLLNELYVKKSIDKKSLNIMQIYCVNAGPTFVISAIGTGVFKSIEIGYALYSSHIISSLIIAFLFGFKLKKHKIFIQKNNYVNKSFSNIFIESVTDATSSVLNICAFITVFSALNACADYIFCDLSIIKHITLFTEVTTSIFKYKNIYLTSFLLGFAGLSVWCQVFSFLKENINYIFFITGRIIHGFLSVIILKIILCVFKIKTSTLGDLNLQYKSFYTSQTLSISIFIMLMVLIAFIYSKNNSGKIIKDMI